MIPKIIHYCWFGGNPEPEDVKSCIRSWKRVCPDYEIRRWDEENFDVTAHPFMKAAYEAKAWAFVSDYARLKVVYDHGGIYLDTDVELVKRLDDVLSNSCYFGIQQEQLLVATGLGFGAEAGHVAVGKMLEQYDLAHFDPDNKAPIACPYLNSAALKPEGFVPEDRMQTVCGAVLYPPRYFDPVGIGDGKDLTCEDTLSVHHYSASWTGGMQRFKRRIARWIGNRRIIRLKGLLKWKH